MRMVRSLSDAADVPNSEVLFRNGGRMAAGRCRRRPNEL